MGKGKENPSQHPDFDKAYRTLTNIRGNTEIRTTAEQWLKHLPPEMIQMVRSQGGESLAIMRMAVRLGLKALRELDSQGVRVYLENEGLLLNYIGSYYRGMYGKSQREPQELTRWQRECVEEALSETDPNDERVQHYATR